MKLTIFAASGGVGRQALEQAVFAGHDVTAVVRNPEKLSPQARGVRIVEADLAAADPAVLVSALQGANAVLSGLGAPSPSGAGIVARGTLAITSAMKTTDVRRIVAVSASPISTVPSPRRPEPPTRDPGDGPLMRFLVGPLTKTLLRRVYADLALTEDILRDSGLDWTVIRPNLLTNSPLTGTYQTAFGQNARGRLRISRANVAHLMLDVLQRPETIKKAIAISG